MPLCETSQGNRRLKGTYDPWLVLLSIAVAVMASYVALDLASRVTASAGRAARYWLIGGALSMGIGIWSMHFIGMLAFRLPMAMAYSASITLLSLLIAMVVSGFALHTVSRERLGLRNLAGGGVLMGIGIAAMHYTGMAAMQMTPPIRYDATLFTLSILVAIVASWAALWIAFQLRGESLLSGIWRRAGSAMLMGAAICGMHYTGMAAAIFSPHSMLSTGAPTLNSVWMAATIAGFTVTLLATTLLVSVSDTRRAREVAEHERGARLLRQAHEQMERHVAERTAELARSNAALEAEVAEHQRTERALRASEDEARAIVDTAYDAYIAMDANGRVLDWNKNACQTFGWTRAQVLGKNLASLIIPLRLRDAHTRGLVRFIATGEGPVLNKRFEILALHRDGREFPVELTIWPVKVGDSYKFNAFLHDVGARRQGIQRLAAQTAAAAALVESGSIAEAAPKVLEAVASALEWPVGALWIVDSDAGVLRCVECWQHKDLPRPAFEKITRSMTFAPGIGLPGRVWQNAKPLWIADVVQDSNFPRARAALEDGLHAAFGFPIVSSTGVLGVAEFFSSAIQAPDQDLLRMMDTVGSLLAQFIERTRAERKLEQDGEFLSALLNNVSEGIIACDERGILTVFNRATTELHGLPAEPLPPEQWAEHYDLYLAGGLTRMPTEQLPLVRAFNGETVRDVEIVVAPKDRLPRTLVCNGQPLVTPTGEKLGAVVAMHDITERKEAEARLVQLAQFDPLTGLPNRRQFYESLRNAMALADNEHWQIPVLFLDLDRFKNVNDTLGHVIGDELLRQVGDRLLGCLRMRDTVGRLGGDEFGIILITPRDPQIAADVAQKLIQALRLPFELDGREVTVTTSIGITVYPVDTLDIDELVRFADTAMYEAKAAGRDTYRFYTAEMNARALEKLELENDLRRAVERGEFVLHYQPKIDIASGAYTGVEALLRWDRPGVGLVLPDVFIPALEETGLIEQVGGWVIDEACRQLVAWRVEGNGPQHVAVNVSARQVMRAPIMREEPKLPSPYAGVVAESIALELAVAVARRDHGIAAGQLELELTESTLMSHAELNVSLLQRLKAQGVGISIDDFGTGYSSLAYLKRFPIDTVKIDRAFIRDITSDPEDAAIVIAIISLAHSLKLKVIAEGVETAEQLDFLGANGCDEAQGYHIARPMPAEALSRLFTDKIALNTSTRTSTIASS
jgi:diguanylate cyclase (GGDEF)-like protein/PAS domain S-box-containing protein